MRHSEEQDVTKMYAWMPKRVSSGKVVWFATYYHTKTFTNVEPKHQWFMEHTYTEWEYFLKKMTNDFSL